MLLNVLIVIFRIPTVAGSADPGLAHTCDQQTCVKLREASSLFPRPACSPGSGSSGLVGA